MIYFDNAATSAPDRECLKAAEKYLYENYYNPSALYAEGYNLHREIARMHTELTENIADSDSFGLIFTSCGTEADNHALFCGAKRGNIVTTRGEHSAVYASANELKQRGADVRFAELNADGSVNADSLLSLVDEKTSLVSVIHVNNETGAVNDINALAEAVKDKSPRALFHSDGVQAFGKIPARLGKYIDMYSLSAHKIGGLKGTGALLKRKTVSIKPYVYGGGQENGMRSGTENVFGIAMLYLAAQKRYKSLTENLEKVRTINVKLREKLDSGLFGIISPEDGSPYILTVTANGVRGETIMHEANDRGLIIGTGSACSSNEKKRYSRVIFACGIDEARADGVLRLSFSPENTVEEAQTAAEILNNVVRNRREIMA